MSEVIATDIRLQYPQVCVEGIFTLIHTLWLCDKHKRRQHSYRQSSGLFSGPQLAGEQGWEPTLFLWRFIKHCFFILLGFYGYCFSFL